MKHTLFIILLVLVLWFSSALAETTLWIHTTEGESVDSGFENGTTTPLTSLSISEEDEILISYRIDRIPMMLGGRYAVPNYIKFHNLYPKIARELGLCGVALIAFVVNTAGIPEKVTIILETPPDYGFGNAGVEVIKAMRFTPGMAREKVVKVPMQMEIKFDTKLLLPNQTIQGPLEGMTFVQIPDGWFVMGSNDGDDHEQPTHKVKVNSFQMMTTKDGSRQPRQDPVAPASVLANRCSWHVIPRLLSTLRS